MTDKSNNNGRAFEFACLNELKNYVQKFGKVVIVENSSYHAAANAYSKVDESIQNNLIKSSEIAVQIIAEFEPMIFEDSEDSLELQIQPDQKGVEGDVRDILISRNELQWGIGLSLKHNHEAAKHPRLSKNLDFGKSWYGIPCSLDYWNDVKGIFEYLEEHKGELWSSIPNKDQKIYIPLLKAFIKEINKACLQDPSVPGKLVSYILGKHDFYKVVSQDAKKQVTVMPYNFHGTLNRQGENTQAKTTLEISLLPSEIIKIGFKLNSTNTVEMILDNEWAFNFRIHNASSKVETSLKFDVTIDGQPATILNIKKNWKN